MHLRNPLCAGDEACNLGDPTWFWDPGLTSPEVQKRDISGPTKRSIFKNFIICNFQWLQLKFYNFIVIWLVRRLLDCSLRMQESNIFSHDCQSVSLSVHSGYHVTGNIELPPLPYGQLGHPPGSVQTCSLGDALPIGKRAVGFPLKGILVSSCSQHFFGTRR